MTQITFSNDVKNAAIKAVYELQYNTNKAAQFICASIPSTPLSLAIEAVNQVAKPSK